MLRQICTCAIVLTTVCPTIGIGTARAATGDDAMLRQMKLDAGWQLQSSLLVNANGDTVSTPQFTPQGWHKTSVPSSVLTTLVKNGVYRDPRVGLNVFEIPDSSDDFNQQHGLAKFSHLGDGRNPSRDPYWYRTEFVLPPLAAGQRVWLGFECINYRAEIWLNGQQVAGAEEVVGMFQRFRLDATAQAKAGSNVLAVKIFPVDHPGTPDTQLEVFGRDRGFWKEIMKDVTEVMTIGYDCMGTVPDRNMGILQEVSVDITGPVDIRHPFVTTDLPLPQTDRATLGISAELTNASPVAVKGVLRGTVAGTEVQFQQPVELAAGETKTVTIDPRPVLVKPRLWWPASYGEQHLYELKLTFTPTEATPGQGQVSDLENATFGVREVVGELYERDGWHGRRVVVNGQKIFCRGGYIQPELLLDWDVRRSETDLRYFREANLNLIYFEDIPNPPDELLDACDRLGLMFGNCFFACGWVKAGSDYPDDLALLERSTIDLIKRYRNHPSLALYMFMDEFDPRQEAYEFWRKHVATLDGTRFWIPSGFFPDSRTDVPPWVKPDLPTGMNDGEPKSYTWQDPVTYYHWVRDQRSWMFKIESGSASLPPVSSLARFLPDLGQRQPGTPFPLTKTWAHHGANHYYQDYDRALRRLYGEPRTVADYCWKGHLLSADQHRAMFEAVNHRMWDITSGLTQWKINACWPSVQWQIFDWYHKPMVSYFFIKKAGEPLHVQLNLHDRMLSVINRCLSPASDLEATVRVFDLESKMRWQKTAKVSVPANCFQEVFAVPELPADSAVCFVKLELKDAAGRVVSDNFYWLPTGDDSGLKALASLPLVRVKSAQSVTQQDGETRLRATITNASEHIAFFVQLAVSKGPGGEEALPVFWEDNYLSLLPGESKEVVATIPSDKLGSTEPVLTVGGWNVATDYQCLDMTVSAKEIRSGEQISIRATIANTFLDGSRIPLAIDGHPVATQFAWARGGQKTEVEFSTTLRQRGLHQVRVGTQMASVVVK